jgi:CubicO group peptidase (beta-lactamase class C family)
VIDGPYTFGYMVGEIVRRVTGTPISQILREDVAGPLGVADELYFGMPEAEHHRLARLEDAPGAEEMISSMPQDFPMFKSATPAAFPTAELGNRTDILAADIPAGGKTSARAIARMYAALLEEVDGIRLISPHGCAKRRPWRRVGSTRSSECRRRGGWAMPSGARRRTLPPRLGWGEWAAASPAPTPQR